MEGNAKAEALERVLDEHPWLVDAVDEGDFWPQPDGSVKFSIQAPTTERTVAGLTAFLEALGFEVDRSSTAEEPPLPDEPPVRFEDVAHLWRTEA